MMTLFKKYWLSVLCIAAIFVLCFMKTSSLPAPPIPNIDKVVHVIMFLGLSGCVFFDNTNYLRVPISKARIFFGTFLFPTLLGGLIEIMQAYLTTYRTGDWFDFLFDGVGAFVGMGIALLINRHLSRSII